MTGICESELLDNFGMPRIGLPMIDSQKGSNGTAACDRKALGHDESMTKFWWTIVKRAFSKSFLAVH